MHGSAQQTFDPLARLRAATAAREAAGLRRQLMPRAADDSALDLARRHRALLVVDEACLRLTGRATLTEADISRASRALAVARDRCHHGRNTAQAGRNTV